MNKSFTSSTLGACFLTFLGFSSAQAVLIDFSVASDYNTNFSEVVNGTDSLTYSSTNGVGGVAGRVNVTQGASTDTTALYNVSSYNLTSGATFTLSAYFLVPNPIGGNAQITAAQVGFSEDLTQGFYSGGGQDYISARVRSAATGSLYTVEGVYANAGTATVVNLSSGFALTAGNWYKITASFTDIGSSFSYSANVDDYGTTGSSLVGAVTGASITSQTLAQTSLSTTDLTAYAGFRAGGNAQNKVVAIDNFEVIPEPSTWAMLASGLVVLGYLRKRSRSSKS